MLTHFKKQHLNEGKDNYKSRSLDLNKKLRNEHQEKSRNNRYKVVNCLRSQHLEAVDTKSSCDNELGKLDITIVDVEVNTTENKGTEEIQTEKEKFVYDLYYTSSDYFGEAELEEKEHIRCVVNVKSIKIVQFSYCNVDGVGSEKFAYILISMCN